MVPKHWFARTLEVTGYSESPVSGFYFDAALHSRLDEDHDMMLRHGTKKQRNAKVMAYFKAINYFGAIIYTLVSGKRPSW